MRITAIIENLLRHPIFSWLRPTRSTDEALPVRQQAAAGGGDQVVLSKAFEQVAAAYNNGDWSRAEQLCRLMLTASPDYFDALNLMGIIAAQTRRPEEAAKLLGRAVGVRPDDASALNNLGNLLIELRRFDQALECLDKAITLEPDLPGIHSNRGIALRELGQLRAAIGSFDLAIRIKPDHAEAYSNRGIALKALRQLDAAIASYDRAITIKPDCAEAHNNRGVALQDLNRIESAIASYNRAIAVKPDYAEAYNNRGAAQQALHQLDAAIASYDCAIAINPGQEWVQGNRLFAKMRICDWHELNEDIESLIANIKQGKKTSLAFCVLPLIDSIDLQRRAAQIWVQAKQPENALMGAIAKQPRARKIRIGYFSADFNLHAVSLLTAGLFETHDKDKFDIHAFSFGRKKRDQITHRIESAVNQFIDCKFKSDEEIVRMARDLNIDIAVDLNGHTQDSRPGVFALRAAPIQINYLGYPGTMGAPYHDYIVADKHLIPEEFAESYSEKIVYLPSFQANDSKKRIADKLPTRRELGLPDSGFVFCCFNNTYKITPDVFECWMRILKAAEGSVLWLLKDNIWASTNLLKEAEKRGLDPARLHFSPRTKLPEYLARYRVADLFLDTLPFNGGATTSDALWAGLPVLTCMGEAFAGRMAGSLLNAIDMPELVTHTREEYEALAIRLASNPLEIQSLRHKLDGNRLTTPLFDTAAFAKNLEDAYAKMYERYQSDLPFDHIYIE